MGNKRKRAVISYILLIILISAGVILNLCLGSTKITIHELYDSLRHPESFPVAYRILTQIRLPVPLPHLYLAAVLRYRDFCCKASSQIP